jgi:hypothetical protein
MPEKNKDYSFAGGLSGINPAEQSSEDIQKIRDVTDEGIKALEERYKNPNWFKVAAGFAKPQLGGFLASLGSAAEAMGENVEQQRENILPITQLKVQREQANMLLGQKIKQNDIFQNWKNSGRPMDEHTYTRIASLGNDTEVAKAAKQFWEQANSRVSTAGTAEELSTKFPRLDAGFKNFVDVAANPTADPELVKKRQADYDATLASARPPQTDPATWATMNREQKQDAVYKYQEAQQKVGLTKEGEFKLLHDQALPRLANMGTIRDLALGKGLSNITVKDKDGKDVVLNGQQQMERLLGMFGGDNPVEVIAKAIDEGRLGDIFKNASPLVRQLYMNPDSRREFEQLSKLLARQNVDFRNAATNPTNAYQELQNSASPSINNSQKALVGIMDMMAHTERNHIGNYLYILQKHPDARHIGADPEFYDRQKKYAEEYRRIATGQQSYNRPWYYHTNEEPRSAERTTPRIEGTPSNTTESSNTRARSNKTVGTNGNIYTRDANGRWVDSGEKP